MPPGPCLAVLPLCLVGKGAQAQSSLRCRVGLQDELASSCSQAVSQARCIWDQPPMLLILSPFPQHRFLPCENKSKAVEKVKRVFSEVRLGCWQGGPEDRDLHPLSKGQRWAGAQQALNFARRECGNPASGVTSSSSEGPPPQLYLFSVKCLWGFLNDCSLPSQACRLGWPASCEHSERGAGESDRGNRK